jgi:hypothetical protein
MQEAKGVGYFHGNLGFWLLSHSDCVKFHLGSRFPEKPGFLHPITQIQAILQHKPGLFQFFVNRSPAFQEDTGFEGASRP